MVVSNNWNAFGSHEDQAAAQQNPLFGLFQARTGAPRRLLSYLLPRRKLNVSLHRSGHSFGVHRFRDLLPHHGQLSDIQVGAADGIGLYGGHWQLDDLYAHRVREDSDAARHWRQEDGIRA